MSRHWNIQPPAQICSVTGRAFEEKETIFSILEESPEGEMSRRDFCEEAWKERPAEAAVSSWRTEYKSRPKLVEEPEALPKDDAETLLRRLVSDPSSASINAPYILALMLERKRILKPIEKIDREDSVILVYEHAKSGETFMIRDPKLRLDQLEIVQQEIALLLDASLSPRSEPATSQDAPGAPPATEPPSNPT